MVRSKTQAPKCQEFWPSQYNIKHDVYLGTTKLIPPHRHSVSIAQNREEVLRYEMQSYDGYKTFETKNQCKFKLCL